MGSGGRSSNPGEEFSLLWARTSRELFRRCLAWSGGRREDAEEALGRTALLAVQHYPDSARSLREPRAWLLRVAYNACMDLHRERRRESTWELDALEVPQPRSAAAHDPERDVLRTELWAYVERCIRELPPLLRDPVERRLLLEHDYDRIADALAITPVNARKRIQFGRRMLRRRLRPYLAGEARSPVLDLAAGRALAAGLRPVSPPLAPPPPARGLAVRAHRTIRVELPAGADSDLVLALRHPPGAATGRRLAGLFAYVERHPTGWKRRLELARALRLEGRLEESAAHYRIAVDRPSAPLAAEVELAETLAALGRREEADRAWARAIGQARSPALAHHLEGLRAAGRADRERAARHFAAAAAAGPGEAAHAAALGAAELAAGRPAEALAALEPLAEDPAAGPDALLALAEALEVTGRAGAARRAVERALTADPGNPIALARSVQARIRAHHLGGDEGQETARRLARLAAVAPGHPETDLAHALHAATLGRVGEAEALIGRRVAERPRAPGAWLAAARLLAALCQRARAAEAADRALTLAPADLELAEEAWVIYPAAGRDADARRLLERLLEAAPHRWQLLIAALRRPEALAPDRAPALSELAVRLQPELHRSWLMHAAVLARAGADAAAVAALERAGELTPADDAHGDAVEAALLLARCRRRAGDLEGARRALDAGLGRAEELAALDPAAAFVHRSRLLAALGDAADTRPCFEAGCESGPPAHPAAGVRRTERFTAPPPERPVD